MKYSTWARWILFCAVLAMVFYACGCKSVRTQNYKEYMRQGKYDGAINEATQLIKQDPSDCLGFYIRGKAYMKKKEYDQAIADFDRAILLNSNIWYYHNWRGVAYFFKAQYDQAMANYDQGIKLNPNKAILYSNRAGVYWQKGLYEKAITEATRAIELETENPSARTFNNRSVFHWKAGYPDQAVSDAEQAIKIGPEHPATYFHLAFFLHKKGRKDKARTYFLKSRELDPQIINYVDERLMSAASLETRRFYEEEKAVANEYFEGRVTETPRPLTHDLKTGVTGQPSIEIYKIEIKPTRVSAGDKFDLVVNYSVSDPSVKKDRIPVKFSYSILEGTKVLFDSKPVVLQALNGERMPRIVHLTATKKKGVYEIKTFLRYKNKIAGESIEFEIE